MRYFGVTNASFKYQAGEIVGMQTPGQLIRDLLESRGWSQRTLAAIAQMNESTITRLVRDQQRVDSAIAIVIEDVFDVPAEHVLALQSDLDLVRARKAAKSDPASAGRARIYGKFPIAEMIKHHWLDAEDPSDVETVLNALARFFGVSKREDIEALLDEPSTIAGLPDPTPTQLAWLRRARHIANDMAVADYSNQSLTHVLPRLQRLAGSLAGVCEVPRLLAESGIRFVLVESLGSAKIDGACIWLHERSPILAISLRLDRIDHFWFVLRHELAHMAEAKAQIGTIVDVELVSENLRVGECAAHRAAIDFFVPTASFVAFVARTAPFIYKRDLMEFARELGVHPGLLAGRLQREMTGYERFREFLPKVGPILNPDARKARRRRVAAVESGDGNRTKPEATPPAT